MEFLKWYSIILMILNSIACVIGLVSFDELEERIKCVLNLLIEMPIIIYIFLK